VTAAAPDFRTIRVEHDAPISWIVLNRPEKANALSNELLEEFSSALEWLRDHGEPVIAIRGEGKGFSAGYDLGQVAADADVDVTEDWRRLRRNLARYEAIWEHPKPVIAAVHGYCIAGATQLVTFTDITIVAKDAKLGVVTVPVGAGYVTPVWAPLVGPKRAKEMAFVTGNSIDGRTAVEWGWANHAVPADGLLDAVRSLAERIALTPPALLALKKAAVNRVADGMGFRAALADLAQFDAMAHQTDDVAATRARIANEGLAPVIHAYRVPSTTDLSGER
jgi:enoyl-CoA hydratase